MRSNRGAAGYPNYRATGHGTKLGRACHAIATTMVGVAIIAAVALVGPATTLAAPVRGVGKAEASETKKPSASRTRARALRRARRAALTAALQQVGGPVDPAARKAVLGSAEAWTGAYRILSERMEGDAIHLEIEVEVDVVRLGKRVRPADSSAGRAVFRLGDVGAAESCGELESLTQLVREELSAQGAVVLDAKGEPVDVALDCQALGEVSHSYLHVAQVRVTVSSEGRTVVARTVPAFAMTPAEALAAGLRQGLGETSDALASHRRGHLRVRVEAPSPTARVRRLETAMRNSVAGVDAVSVGAVEPGLVELHVRGRLDAKTLSRRIEALVLPGFSASTVDVEPPDVLTIRLQ